MIGNKYRLTIGSFLYDRKNYSGGYGGVEEL